LAAAATTPTWRGQPGHQQRGRPVPVSEHGVRGEGQRRRRQGWLETAAKRFNQIDPAKTTEQQLISTFPGYNFDMFTDADMQYEIDVTQPVGSRIKNLTYKGAPVTRR
jgi:2',3'-cyclic-nucleotide 2'-phosphodiesterase (5'-nucleotidase family)